MTDVKEVKPRVFFARKDKEGKRFASGTWDDGTKVYIKNFRESNNGLVADVDYQTNEQYENNQGKLVFRHKICGAVSISAAKATLIIEINGKKERLTCTPRQVNAKTTGEPLLLLDFSDGDNPYVNDLFDDEPAEEKTVDLDSIDQLVDDTVPF